MGQPKQKKWRPTPSRCSRPLCHASWRAPQTSRLRGLQHPSQQASSLLDCVPPWAPSALNLRQRPHRIAAEDRWGVTTACPPDPLRCTSVYDSRLHGFEHLLWQPAIRRSITLMADALSIYPATFCLFGHRDHLAFEHTQGATSFGRPINDHAVEADALHHSLRDPTFSARFWIVVAKLCRSSVHPAVRRTVRHVHERPFRHTQLSRLIGLPIVHRDVKQAC